MVRLDRMKAINKFHYESQVSRVNDLFEGLTKDLQQTWDQQIQDLKHSQKTNQDKITKKKCSLKELSELIAQKGAVLTNQQSIFPFLNEEDAIKHLAHYTDFLDNFENQNQCSSDFSVEFSRFSRTRVAPSALFSKHHKHLKSKN